MNRVTCKNRRGQAPALHLRVFFCRRALYSMSGRIMVHPDRYVTPAGEALYRQGFPLLKKLRRTFFN